MRIKYFLQSTLLCSAIMGLMGCGTMQNYTREVHSWDGAPESALFQSWGAPEETTKLADGNNLYTYRYAAPEPVIATTNGYNRPGYVRTNTQAINTALVAQPPLPEGRGHNAFWCETSFEANPSGMIVNSSFQGNDCSASKNNMQHGSYQH